MLGYLFGRTHASEMTLVVTTAAGSTYDHTGRAFAEYLSLYLPGNPKIIVKNIPGASGAIGTTWLYDKAPRDGNTIALINKIIPLTQLLDPVNFDSRKFVWIGSPVRPGETIVVSKSTGVESIEDVKRREVSLGATSAAGTLSMLPKMLNELAGTKFRIIRGYPGERDVILAMYRKEVEGKAGNPFGVYRILYKDFSKGLNPIVHLSLKRDKEIPNTPLVQEIVKKEKWIPELMASISNIGRPIVMPPGVPEQKVAELRNAFAKMVKDPGFKKRLYDSGLEIDPVYSDELTGMVNRILSVRDTKRLREVIR